MQVNTQQIEHARQVLLPDGSVHTPAECLQAVDRLGFVWAFTPGNRLLPALFPALATETEGQRWDWMWTWKDRFAASREAYYGKVVGGKPTLVSRRWLPAFYALTGLVGEPEDDLLHTSQLMRLSEMAIKAFRYLLDSGPTGTRTLQARLTDGTRPMKTALEKGLEQLDSSMLIVKCGTEGGNSIANVWDLFSRFHPEAVAAGTEIPTRAAALDLTRQFFRLTPALPRRSVGRLFPWNEGHQEKAIARLLETGELKTCTVDGKAGLARADFCPTE